METNKHETNQAKKLYDHAISLDRNTHLIGRVFKKVFLLTNPQLRPVPGALYEARWRHNRVRDFVLYNGECYQLSLKDLWPIFKQIRSSRPEFVDLEYSGVLRALKQLSLILYVGPSVDSWKTIDKCIFLKPTQLSPEGRLGKIPLRKGLRELARKYWNTRGVADEKLLGVLQEDHKLKSDEIQGIFELIINARKARMSSEEAQAQAETYIDDLIEKHNQVSANDVELPAEQQEAIAHAEHVSRTEGEIKEIFHNMYQLILRYRQENLEQILALRNQLKTDYGMTEDQIDRRISDIDWYRVHPNARKH